MKQLIITEKPSVAINIANALGVKNRKDGYIENDKYIISWCLGHLDTLANADSYDGKYAIWRKEDLPILPAPWRLKIADKIKYDHFKILKSLMYRKDVTEIINACDAGREGELIFRNMFKLSECRKPVKRLWISSMEDEAIIEGFKHLKPSKFYDNLYFAADCRAKADWLVGINLTRFFSVIYHRTLNVGRVVTPTLALIISRQAEIDAFEPTPYYNIELESGNFKAKTDKIESKEKAENILADCKKYDFATCYRVACQAKEEKAPLLYDLTSLQRDANKKLGYTAQQTLNLVQSLYEKKLCTYSKNFLSEHEGEIILHRAAKKTFGELGAKKIPSVKSINKEFDEVLKKKKGLYSQYHSSKEKHREMLKHQANIHSILGITVPEKSKKEQEQSH